MAAIRGIRRIGVPSPQATLVIAPAGAGSLGDQAMLEVIRKAFDERFSYDTTILYEEGATPHSLKGPFRAIVLSDVSSRRYRQIAVPALVASKLIFVGADTLDGTYNVPLIDRWLRFIDRMQRLGLKCGILNYSFSAAPDETVCRRLGELKNVFFSARDAHSLARFRTRTGQQAELGADCAFLLEPEITSPNAARARDWLKDQKTKGRTTLIVNASGHTLEKMRGQGVQAYAELFIRWLKADLNRAILLLPHDLRPAPAGDVDALEAIATIIRSQIAGRIELVRPPIAAWDVKALCADAHGVFTGRMHLAIAALGMGAPPLSIVYVNKFEGLMGHFELEGGLITPSEFLDGIHAYNVLETFTKELPERRSKILARLPAVRELALRQFELFQEFAK